jgi:transposase
VIADNRHIEAVVGLDLGDKNSWMTRLELNGSESLSCSMRTSPSTRTKYFSKQKRLRVVIEAGSHSNGIAQLLERLGHEVIVAHPRQLKLISESPSKNDRRDADLLAELGLTSPKLLAPTQPRSLELGISRIGDRTLRCLLVQCAHYVLGRHGEDSALRRWGLKLAGRGGKNAKKRAIVAVARKLAVLMHLLWSGGEVYDPFYGVEQPTAQAVAQAAA